MSNLKLISECFVRPQIEVDESKRVHHLNPFDLRLLLVDYLQLGFLFTKPSDFFPSSYLERLRFTLSQALVYFYPLAGRLVTVPNEADHSCYKYVDCTKGPGARLLHASAQHLTMVQVSRPNSYNAKLVRPFFDLGEMITNHDGHTKPLLSVQLTELQDGVFLGIGFNHSVVDGISAFLFQRVWSNIFMGTFSSSIPLPLVESPAFLDGRIIKLPCVDPNEFNIRSIIEGELRRRVFKFSTQSLKKLKDMANSEAKKGSGVKAYKMISTFQALIAFVWKCVTRARNLPSDELTTIALPINLRPRFKPPLSDNYFGNYSLKARECVKVGDLLDNSLGWAATLLQQLVDAQDDRGARALILRALDKGPELVPPTQILRSSNVSVGASARFDPSKSTFGLGRLLAFRDGYGNQVDGKVNAFLGSECDGSIDLNICLAPDTMAALLSDQQFMCFTSQHNAHLNLFSRV